MNVLHHHTATPHEAYAGIWAGWTSRVPAPTAPAFDVVGRRFLLFTGSVSDLRWAAGTAWNGEATDGGAEPHWLWPADRAWFLACDVDEEVDFSVGCTAEAAHALLAQFATRARVVAYGTE